MLAVFGICGYRIREFGQVMIDGSTSGDTPNYRRIPQQTPIDRLLGFLIQADCDCRRGPGIQSHQNEVIVGSNGFKHPFIECHVEKRICRKMAEEHNPEHDRKKPRKSGAQEKIFAESI